MLTSSGSPLMALRLFERSFGAGAQQQFSQFLERLKKCGLDWILDKIRREEFPPNPGLEEGMPDFYYYYISDTLWGTSGPAPAEPLGVDFAKRADGVGLNFGCPLRLHAALKVLERIEPRFDGDCTKSLKTNHKHLPTVEELLWGDAWQIGLSADRNTYGNGNKLPDWRVNDSVGDILVEAKFLPSDWARHVDGPTHLPKECMKRAAAQLPVVAPSTTLNVVAFTGYADMDIPFGEIIEAELLKYPHIDAVIYRTFRSDTSLMSLDSQAVTRLRECLRFECMSDFQPFYPFSWVIAEKESREIERQKIQPITNIGGSGLGNLFCEQIPLTCIYNRFRKPPFQYRRTLLRRESDGEPIFRVEAPEVPHKN